MRVMEWTVGATRSMKVEEPGVAVKRAVVVEPKTVSPRVRSRTTS